MRTKDLFAFIHERQEIYQRRLTGAPKPWTQDPILQQWRFCNVYRELDTVTIWIRKNWREPHKSDSDLWFGMVVARLLNLPSSLEAIGYPVPWRADRFKKILQNRKAAGMTIFSGAYMIHADAVETGLKTDYLADFVLTPMWKNRSENRFGVEQDSLAYWHERLMYNRDMGSFMAGQIIADAKYEGKAKKATDWWTWAAPGPGSMRGLNRVYGGEPTKPWKGNSWATALQMLQVEIDPLMHEADMPRLHAQDLQNCLCEFDKYERVRLGEGRPKQKYDGLGLTVGKSQAPQNRIFGRTVT